MQLFAIITGVLALAPAALAQGFMDSCSSISLAAKDNSTLRATCATVGKVNGQTELTTDLDLNLCIGYSWAKQQLLWEYYGKFNVQCSHISLDSSPYLGKGVWLTAHCWDLSDPSNWSKVVKNLDKGIMNDNGYLACHSWGRGTVVPGLPLDGPHHH